MAFKTSQLTKLLAGTLNYKSNVLSQTGITKYSRYLSSDGKFAEVNMAKFNSDKFHSK